MNSKEIYKNYWHFPEFENWDDVMAKISDDDEFEIRCNIYDTALDFANINPFASFLPFFAICLTHRILSSNSKRYRKVIWEAFIGAEREFNRSLVNREQNESEQTRR